MNYKKIFTEIVKGQGSGKLRKGSFNNCDFLQLSPACAVILPTDRSIFKDNAFHPIAIPTSTLDSILPLNTITEGGPDRVQWGISNTIEIVDKAKYRILVPPADKYIKYAILENYLALFDPTVHIWTYARADRPGILYMYEATGLAGVVGPVKIK